MKRSARLLVLMTAAIGVIAAVVCRTEREPVAVKEPAAPIAETAAESKKEAPEGTRHNRALMYLLR